MLLRQKTTGRVYRYHPQLAKRVDMVPEDDKGYEVAMLEDGITINGHSLVKLSKRYLAEFAEHQYATSLGQRSKQEDLVAQVEALIRADGHGA